jgi:hypothetical protein
MTGHHHDAASLEEQSLNTLFRKIKDGIEIPPSVRSSPAIPEVSEIHHGQFSPQRSEHAESSIPTVEHAH